MVGSTPSAWMWRAIAHANGHFVLPNDGTTWKDLAQGSLKLPPAHGVFTRLWHVIFPATIPSLSLVGLDAAGKTTLAYTLRDPNYDDSRIPTRERYIVFLEKRKLEFLWLIDLGGQDRIRSLYARCAQPITVFMVDSSDRERMGEARKELHWWASIPEVQAIFILCNKQDVPNAQSVIECADALALESLPVPFFVTGSCALTPDDLEEVSWSWLWLCIDVATHNPSFGRSA